MDIYRIAQSMKLERKTIYDLKIKVTFYARVSTEREEQESSIESQIVYFTDMIKSNSNWEFVEGYVDQSRGEQTKNRKAFMQMIEDGKSGKFDLILTKEVSRFARNTIDSLTYTKELLHAGVGVFFQNDNICTIDTDSELRLTIMSSIATDEVRKLSERVKWGMKRSTEKGYINHGGNIFGYQLVDHKLVINPEEAAIVKRIYEMYADHVGMGKISEILWKEGYRAKGGGKFHREALYRIVRNPKYKGYFCANKSETVDYQTGKRVYNDKNDWVMYKDETGEVVPAIVSEELWNKVNSGLEKRSEDIKSRRHSFKPNPLTGKIECMHCNTSFWRNSQKKYRKKTDDYVLIESWFCSQKFRKSSTCPSIRVDQKYIYAMIEKILPDIVCNINEYIETYLMIVESVLKDDNSEQNAALNDRKKKLETRKSNVIDLGIDGILSKEELTIKLKEINDEIAVIDEKLSESERIKFSQYSFEDSMNQVKETIENICSGKEELTKEALDIIILDVIDKIYMEPVDKKEMNVHIALKTGSSIDTKLNKKMLLGNSDERGCYKTAYKIERNICRMKFNNKSINVYVSVNVG